MKQQHLNALPTEILTPASLSSRCPSTSALSSSPPLPQQPSFLSHHFILHLKLPYLLHHPITITSITVSSPSPTIITFIHILPPTPTTITSPILLIIILSSLPPAPYSITITTFPYLYHCISFIIFSSTPSITTIAFSIIISFSIISLLHPFFLYYHYCLLHHHKDKDDKNYTLT